MEPISRVLVIGGTGLIGLPVTRQLVDEGFDVTALVRDPARARAILPDGCHVQRGDLRDRASIDAALDGVDAVYLSLANAMTSKRPAWDADADGTMTVLDAAQRAGTRRLARLSAMGIAETKGDWWVARVKREVDAAIADSGVPFTIFRPTWLMESIAISAVGPMHIGLPAPDDPIYWLAAEDYGRQVAAALRRDDAENRVYQNQGPEGVSMAEAFRRFRAVWRRFLVPAPMPGFVLRAAARFERHCHYLASLLDMTYEVNVRQPAVVEANDLYDPTVTIDEYARDLLTRRHYPRKTTR